MEFDPLRRQVGLVDVAKSAVIVVAQVFWPTKTPVKFLGEPLQNVAATGRLVHRPQTDRLTVTIREYQYAVDGSVRGHVGVLPPGPAGTIHGDIRLSQIDQGKTHKPSRC